MEQKLIICGNCKTPNPARNLYCQTCGRPLIPTSPLSPSLDVTQPMPGPQTSHTPEDPTIPQPSLTVPNQPYRPPTEQQFQQTPVGYNAPGGYAGVPQGYAQPGVQPGPSGTIPQSAPPSSSVSSEPGYATYIPPAGPDIFQRASASSDTIWARLRNGTFSARVDSWNELIQDAGDMAGEIERSFVDLFNRRRITYVDLSQVEATSGLLQRTYQVAHHRSGSVTVYANPAGNDLMVGWELNIQQKPNWKMIGFLALACLVISFLSNLAVGWAFGHFLVEWILGVFGPALTVMAGGLIAGKILKGDIWYLYVEKPDAAGEQELAVLAKAAHQSLLQAVKNAGLKLGS